MKKCEIGDLQDERLKELAERLRTWLLSDEAAGLTKHTTVLIVIYKRFKM